MVIDVKNWYLIITDASNKTVKDWNRMQNATDLEGFFLMCGIRMYAI